jgi:bacterioferritin-associated ferredoxin
VATNCGCCAELAHELLEETSAPAGPSPAPLHQPA